MDFHPLQAIRPEGGTFRSECECGYTSDAVSSEHEAEHRHAAHAWVAEPYMTA